MAPADANDTLAPGIHVPEDPLQMAGNLVAAVARLSKEANTDPRARYSPEVGAHAEASAAMAAQLATVSIARDIRRIADHLTGGVP